MLEQLLGALPPRPDIPDRLALRAAAPGLLRDLAAQLLEAALGSPDRADPMLRERFRQDRRLGSHDRALLKDGVYGVIRRHPLDGLLLGRGGWMGERAPLALWLAWLVRERGVPAEVAASSFGAAVFGALERSDAALRAWVAEDASSAAGVLATLGALPEWLAQTWIAELGPEEAAALAVAMGGRAPLVLRVNRLRTDPAGARRALEAEGIPCSPGRWSPDALVVDGAANVVGSAAFARGLVEVQDEGSQLVAALVQPPPGGLVVDLCAGAGGKALAIAPALRGGARVRGFDVREEALRQARRRAERSGAQGLRFERLDPEGVAPVAPGRAARVLVDAPCTGTGTLRRAPGLRWRLRPEDLEQKPALQLRILERALPLVAPEGRLIYATCSVQRAENEAVVEALLDLHPEWAVRPAAPLLGPAGEALCRGPYLATLPHRHATDGFFAAVLERRG